MYHTSSYIQRVHTYNTHSLDRVPHISSICIHIYKYIHPAWHVHTLFINAVCAAYDVYFMHIVSASSKTFMHHGHICPQPLHAFAAIPSVTAYVLLIHDTPFTGTYIYIYTRVFHIHMYMHPYTHIHPHTHPYLPHTQTFTYTYVHIYIYIHLGTCRLNAC